MIDKNNDQIVCFNEFSEMFKSMDLDYTLPELKSLFDAIDSSRNDQISYNELLNYVRESKREEERIKRLKFLTERTESIQYRYKFYIN